MERTNSMGEKKAWENGANADSQQQQAQQPELKSPTYASVMREVWNVESVQRLCSMMEPVIRRVVHEEVQCALGKQVPSTIKGTTRTESANYSVQSLSGPIECTEEGEEGNSKE